MAPDHQGGHTLTEPQVIDLTIDELVERARGLAVPGGRHILGLTGAPGAGKSTVAANIVDALGPELAVLVPMDGFHLANAVLDALGRRDRKGAHDTFDGSGYTNLLHRLHRSSTAPGTASAADIVYAPEFHRDIEESIGSATPIHPKVPLVVTEGNYLLLESDPWPRARSFIDEVWFLAPSDDVRQHRLILRHEAYGKSPEQARAWTLGSDQTNAELIESTAPRADLIVRPV